MNVSETLATQGRRQMDQSHFIDNRLSHTAVSVTKNEKSITLISTFVTNHTILETDISKKYEFRVCMMFKICYFTY